MEERILRTLSIKAFHVQAAREEKCFSLEKEENNQYTLCFDSSVPGKLAEKEPLIHSASLKLISKEERHVPILFYIHAIFLFLSIQFPHL